MKTEQNVERDLFESNLNTNKFLGTSYKITACNATNKLAERAVSRYRIIKYNDDNIKEYSDDNIRMVNIKYKNSATFVEEMSLIALIQGKTLNELIEESKVMIGGYKLPESDEREVVGFFDRIISRDRQASTVKVPLSCSNAPMKDLFLCSISWKAFDLAKKFFDNNQHITPGVAR